MVDAHTHIPFLDMEFLDVLSVTAISTTLGLFLCGIPICRNIARKGTTEGISGAPFFLGVIGCCFWLRYGFLKDDNSVVTINGIGAVLQITYLAFFYTYTRGKGSANQGLLMVVGLIGCMLYYISGLELVDKTKAVDHLGMMCLFFNILGFAAPMAGLRDVLRIQSTENLPFPLIFTNLLVSAQWFLYGILVTDPYIKIPNAVGIVLAILQLSLFAIYPSRRAHAT